MKKIIIYTITLIFLSSCSTSESLKLVNVSKGNQLIKAGKKPPKDGDDLQQYYVVVYDIIKPKTATITSDDNKLKINLVDNNIKGDTILLPTKYNGTFIIQEKYQIPYNFEYSNLISNLRTDKLFSSDYNNIELYKNSYWIDKKFKYTETKAKWQAVTIPFKVRFETDEKPYNLSTSVNVGFTISWKKIYHSYRPISESKDTKPFANKTSQFELGLAPFLGITAIDLEASNTNDIVENDRKIFGLSFGIFGMIGIDDFDIGVGIGIDHGFSNQSSDWIYQNKPWIGLILGIDLIK